MHCPPNINAFPTHQGSRIARQRLPIALPIALMRTIASIGQLQDIFVDGVHDLLSVAVDPKPFPSL
jgi:hypothetical protein